MKKQLLTTTALVAAGLMVGSGAALAQAKASKPSLTIGGWVEGIFGFADQDDEVIGNRVNFDSQYDSEFLFQGSVTLDNGIRIRTVAELEGENSGDQWDEAYMSISGSFGAIRVGSEDSAAHLMVTPYSGSWAVQVGQNLNLDTGDWLTNPADGPIGVRLDLGDSDANMITYFTPRIEGFQLGVSYIPSFEECGAVPGTNGGTNVTCNSSIATTSQAHEGWSFAANFDRKFDQVRVGLGAGYTFADAGAGTSEDQGDPHGYAFGALLGFGGFEISAGYKRQFDQGGVTDRDNEKVLDIGAAYHMGRNHFSVAWISGESPAAGGTEDEADVIGVQYRRDLGPGVQYRLNFFYADFEGGATGSTDDNDGYAITTSVRVAF